MALRNGESIRFWHDLWIGNEPLASRFNRLFHLDSDPNGSIASKVVNGSWVFNWNRDFVGGRNEQSLSALIESLGSPTLADKHDEWTCSSSKDGMFFVKHSRLLIDRRRLPSAQVGTLWFSFIPRKVNIFFVAFPFRSYSLRDLWHKISIFLGYGLPHLSSWESFVVWLEGVNLPVTLKNRIVAVTITTLWALWRFRNGIVFHDSFCSKSSLFDAIFFIEAIGALEPRKSALEKMILRRKKR
ncbi:uncharacterized protein [Rutidosis leptorrhynchoides]|uniref:uncharacterized protein n=1 Tax=Rutidosis leptorrhynchoides TaxID=125765 RepID=UPI003A996580